MQREWHIWDFPDNIYVKFSTEYKIKIYNMLKEKYKTRPLIAKALFCRPESVIRIFENSTDLLAVRSIRKIVSIFPQTKNELERNIVAYRGANKGFVNKPVLPIKETPKLYNIIAHLIGDGTFRYYSNTCKELLKEFSYNLKIFGKFKISEKLIHTNVYIITFPRVISRILEHLFDIRFIRPDRFPKTLFTASKECKAAALRAMFDDEGSIKKPQRCQITIWSVSQNILKELKMLLDDFSIDSGKVCSDKRGAWYFSVSTGSYETFLNEIGFTHPKKIDRLVNTVKHRNRFKELRQNILRLIEENPTDRFEVAKQIGHPLESVTIFMYELRKQGRIKSNFVGKNKNYIWSKV